MGTPHVFNQRFLPDTGVIPHVYPETWSALWYLWLCKKHQPVNRVHVGVHIRRWRLANCQLGGSAGIVASLLEEGEVGIRKRSVRITVNDAVDRRKVVL